MSTKKPVRESAAPKLVLLTESELDKAEAALAAKNIMSKLERMAADVTRIEGNDIMPLMGAMRQSYGQQFADKFNENVIATLRSTSEALTKASMAIASEVNKMEAIISGEEPTDMALGDEGDLGGFEEPEMGAQVGDEDMGELPSFDDEEAGAQMADDDIDAAFGDIESAEPAAGRGRKNESVNRNIATLRESANPNRLIYESFAKALKMTDGNVELSIMSIAETFSIDPADVISVVREGKTWKDEKGKGDKKDFKHERRAKKKDKEEHLEEETVVAEGAAKKKAEVEDDIEGDDADRIILDESILNRLKPRKKIQDLRVVKLDAPTEEEALKRATKDYKEHVSSSMEVPYIIAMVDGDAKQFNAPLSDPFVVRVVNTDPSELRIWNGKDLTPKWRVQIMDGKGRIPPNVKRGWTDGPTYRVLRRGVR